jgi:hypothetical protein
LGLTIHEHGAIKDANDPNNPTGLSTLHNRYIYLELNENLRHNGTPNGIKFREFIVRLQGLDENGNRKIITPYHMGSPIMVYSRDNLFFSSIAYSESEDVNLNEINRIEYHTFHDGCVKINDNIDLSLLRENNNDQTVAANILEQRIFFFYIDAEREMHSVCNLEARQINKMDKGKNKDANGNVYEEIPTGYIDTIEYTNVNADYSRIFANGDVWTYGMNGEGTDSNYILKFKNLNKKAFIVHFDADSVDNDNAGTVIQFSYSGTLRQYFKPEVAAAFIGALIDIGALGVSSGGCCFKDGTCFPSVSHVNGNAVDTGYKILPFLQTNPNATQAQKDVVLAQDQQIIDAMAKFGFDTIYKGQSSTFDTLTTAIEWPDHNKHLHSGNLNLNNCDEELIISID